MAIEIERKFLVANDGWRRNADCGRRIRQAYLASSSTNTVRIRITEDARARLTIKSGFRGNQRDEFEYDIPLEDARRMLDLRLSGIIEKVRYQVAADDAIWEIDVFSGDNAGLVLAEIELTSADQSLDIPDWIDREVSGDNRYQNSALASVPYTTWPEP